MGKAGGTPTPADNQATAELAQMRAFQRAMMQAQANYQAPPWVRDAAANVAKPFSVPPDLYIAGQRFDGMTGERK